MNVSTIPKTDIVNTLVQTVKQDVELLEKSGQWAFSSYSPAKECDSIPGIGLDDISPEEMRFEAYTAKFNNTLPAFQQSMQNINQTYAAIRRQLLNPTPSIKEALCKLYKEDSSQAQKQNSIFGGGFGQTAQGSGGLFGGVSSSNNSGGLFGGANQSSSFATSSSTKSIFGGGASTLNQGSSHLFGGASSQSPQQSSSIFGGSSSSTPINSGGGSLFGSSSQASSSNPFASFQQKPQQQQQQTSIFSSPSQQGNLFSSVQQQSPQGGAVFGQTQPLGGGIFSNNSVSGGGGGIFGGSGNVPPVATAPEAEGMNEEVIQESSILSSNTMPPPTTNPAPPALSSNVFQAPTQIPSTQSNSTVKTGLFGQVIRRAEDPSIFSKMEDLTAQELEVFKTKSYFLGSIPEIPPPRELCT